MADGAGEEGAEFVGVDGDLVVDGPGAAGDGAGVRGLGVGPPAPVGEVEGVQRRRVGLAGVLGGEGGDEAGVEAAAGDGADGHLGPGEPADLVAQDVLGAAEGFRAVGAAASDDGGRARADEGGGAGRQDVDSGERGVGGEGGAGGEDGVEGVLARGDPYAFEGEEGGDLGGEAGGAVVRVVVQVERLHAHVVDGEDELRTAGPQVEEGDGEHAVEVFGEGGSVLGVERGEHGAVAAVGEPVAAGGEGAAELGVVVDLAVEDGEDAGQVGQPVGLPAAAGVGDGEPVAAEGPCSR
ncbi:hypothetical protein STANM309S_03621 [Streptomyces tanashiensis]